MVTFLDRYVVRRAWWRPWNFIAIGWVSDAPFGMCRGRLSPYLKSLDACAVWMYEHLPAMIVDNTGRY